MTLEDDLADAYRNGFVDGQAKAAIETDRIKRSIRASAFSDGYDAGYKNGFDAGFPKGVRMSDIAAEDLQKILMGISTKDLVNELSDRINDGEKLPTYKRNYITYVTQDGEEHIPY